MVDFGASWVLIKPSNSSDSWNPGGSIDVEWHSFHDRCVSGDKKGITVPMQMRQENFGENL
jgi:hypothetical protein